MKSKSTLKSILTAIGSLLLVYLVLSWIIPGGSFSELTFTKDTTYPLGLSDLITYPIATIFSSDFAGVPFIMIGIIFLAIGGLYGVMNKTGVYSKIVDKTVSIFEKKKTMFLIISIIVFALLSSLTTLSYPIFILVPFMVTVILLLGFDKITALLSTVGAMLVGNMATMYGYNKDSLSYFNVLFNNGINDLIVMKIVLFVVSVLVLALIVILMSKKTVKTAKSKKAKKEELEEIPLYTKESKQTKSGVAMFIILVLTIIIPLVGMYSWSGAFGIDIFTKFHEAITTFKINGNTILANILGTSNNYLGFEIGTWGNFDLIVILLLSSLIIGKVYKLKLKEIFTGFTDGAKKMLKVALVAILANTIYLIVVVSYNSGETLFIASIVNRLLSITTKLNYFVLGGITAVASPLFNELPYLAAILQQPLLSAYENYPLVTVIIQAVYGFMMMILPTSVILVAGLAYTDISIKEYFKGSWKVLIGLFVAITAVILLFMYCPGIKVM